MIPVLGTLIAGQWEPYQYLVESIRRFPRQEEFKVKKLHITVQLFSISDYSNETKGIWVFTITLICMFLSYSVSTETATNLLPKFGAHSFSYRLKKKIAF